MDDKKIDFFLYENIALKKGIFSIWKNFSFWDYFLNEEIKKIKNDSDLSNDYLRILSDITIKMIYLKIEVHLISRIVKEFLEKNYIKNVKFFFNLKEKVIEKIKFYLKKYIEIDMLRKINQNKTSKNKLK